MNKQKPKMFLSYFSGEESIEFLNFEHEHIDWSICA